MLKLSQIGSAKTDTLVKLVLIFFISLLSFSVGTFVGKQFSDSQYKMAQLEGNGDENSEREPSSVDPASLEATPPDALTEEDIASLEEEFSKGKTVDSDKSDSKTTTANEHTEKVAANEHGEKAEAKGHEKVGKADVKKVEHMVNKATEHAADINHDAKQVKAAHTKKADEKIAEIADRVVKGETPMAHKADAARTPSNVLPATVANDVVGKYTVQVSAYNNEPDAVEHTKALKDKGFSAFYVAAAIKGKTWFRVSVGLYSTSKEAEDYRKKIIGAEIKSAIVQKIVQN